MSFVGALVTRLCSDQHADGSWRDFRSARFGLGTEWVTAYVLGTAMASDCITNLESADVATAVKAGIRFLETTQRFEGGWGYNGAYPIDCDSTALAALALKVLGAASWNEAAAREVLLAHQESSSGGFATFASTRMLEEYYRQMTGSAPASFAGWCRSHVEVTATALEALMRLGEDVTSQPLARATEYLIRHRGSDGLWRGYWSVGPFYATYRVLRTLRLLRVANDEWIAMAARSLAELQRTDGSWGLEAEGDGCIFSTALALGALGLGNCSNARSSSFSGLQWLAGMVAADRLVVDRFLRVPPPGVENPDGYLDWGTDGSGRGALFDDPQRVFSTATIVGCIGGMGRG